VAKAPSTLVASFVKLAPRNVRERLFTLRRDLQMVRSDLLGERPAPFALRPRPQTTHATDRARTKLAVVSPRATALAPRLVRVARINRETADAVSLELVDPTGAPFVFVPGQFLTVLLSVGDRAEGGESLETIRRAYSIASSACDTRSVTIATKRVEGGLASNHINDIVREGDLLAVFGPSGGFTLVPSPEARRHIVLLAGGSGITPMMSILRTVLAIEPKSRISLVYGNRSKRDIIFHDALAMLSRDHAERLVVRHVLATPHDGFVGGVGLFDRAAVARELDTLSLEGPENSVFYICGPEPMMVEARAALLARGVSELAIHEERFTQPHLRERAARVSPSARASTTESVTVRLSGLTQDVTVSNGATLLEAALGAGLAMPFSCAMGGCGACVVTVVSGQIEMEEPNCLTKEERARGCALTCIGRPIGPTVVEVS
jgi:ring-1,2-phenylacetyl-CoA epoxidase subunit PaaE